MSIAVALQVEKGLAGVGIEHGCAVALGGRGNELAVWAEGNAIDILAITHKRLPDRRAGARIPYADRVVVAARHDEIAVDAECDVVDLLRVALEGRQLLPREGVDYPHAIVAKCHRDPMARGRELRASDVSALVELLLGREILEKRLHALRFRRFLQKHGPRHPEGFVAVDLRLCCFSEPQARIEAHPVLLEQERCQRAPSTLHRTKPDGLAVELGKLIGFRGAEHEYP